MKSIQTALILITSILLFAGCSPAEPEFELANSASEHCEEQGGILEIRTDEEGGQVGYCLFSDGSECEEWAFFNGECAPGGEQIADTSEAEVPPAEFSEPFDYCAAVGTIDIPDAQYVGDPVPDTLIAGMQDADLLSEDMPEDLIVRGTFWRCMDGQVWACFVGANLPCQAKADTSETPSIEMEEFCQEDPNADFIPAAVTGRETVYAWRCKDGVPEIDERVFEPDAQGFLSDFWYQISLSDE